MAVAIAAATSATTRYSSVVIRSRRLKKRLLRDSRRGCDAERPKNNTELDEFYCCFSTT